MHCQCVQRTSISPKVWTNVNMTETEEISEFKSPEMNFSYICEGRRSFFETFFGHDKTEGDRIRQFCDKNPRVKKIIYEKCQKCKIDPFT